jgi:ParB/RepB/Spo0J family partition protein
MADPWEKYLSELVKQGGEVGDLARKTLKQLNPSAEVPDSGASDAPSPPPAPGSEPARAAIDPRALPDPVTAIAPASDPKAMVFVLLDKLEPNPFQPRNELGDEDLESFRDAIRIQGLLTPITVRETPIGYQIIDGHRRVRALRGLEFSTVPAIVRPNVNDAQMVLWGYAQNVQRSSLSPVETAFALKQIRDLLPEATSEDVATVAGLHPRAFRRFLQLAEAPPVVQSAADEGIPVPVENDSDDPPPEDGEPTFKRRKLDLSGALHFARLHEFLLNKHAGKDAQLHADGKTGDAIERALKADWGVRQIQRYVDKALADKKVTRGRGRPGRPFKTNSKQLIIYYDRVAKLSPDQKTALKKLLEPLWRAVSDAP